MAMATVQQLLAQKGGGVLSIGPDDTVYARAETTLVLYDFATSTPRRMDPALREVLTAHAGDPVPFRWRRR